MSMKRLGIILLIFLGFSYVSSAEEDIRSFFEEITISGKAYNISFGSAEEIETLIVETDDIKDGTYEISVTRVDNHIYKIDETKYYIEMPYCYEYSYGDKAIMKVESYMGYKVGTLIFIED